ncbi:NAD(P)-dependent alcohol dehydrogenase [Rhizobium sp. CCGE 510]|uniref:zinc-dependent alcohol dehydrogenase family protein n=1 Tax=Rhizobium sp. CCGE 510 TaxID=1132836 RepID=UPI00027B8DAD|nr:NAD(P)-dependent alcohol dehydrogenase [Rhizobium sp. CCGE 510]EJT06511.1 alcohol dehydrogenase [Rhizobium sp. CCGE 510]
MRAYYLNGTNGIDSVQQCERPDPTPGRGQVLIRMHAVSLNYRDLMVAQGQYGAPAGGGIIPLSDGAGEVIAVGTDVTRFVVGDRVSPTFMTKWIGGAMSAPVMSSALGGDIDGVLAELVVCDEHAAVRLPNHLSYEQAACLPCAALTAWSALHGPRPVAAGDVVLTLGTGGVSVFAVQFAHAAGARIIATSSSDKKLEALRGVGASDLINYSQHPEWEHEVLRLTNGRGVDHVVETVGGGTLPQSITATAVSGHVHLIGVLSGGQLDPLSLMTRKTLRGIMVGSTEEFEAMNRVIDLHRIEPIIDRVYAFDEAPKAYEHLASSSHVGKIVVRID